MGSRRLAAIRGDVGWLDQDGYLYIVDRRVDMIVDRSEPRMA